jgi:selenocysteine lyase/cysteine desulfurase
MTDLAAPKPRIGTRELFPALELVAYLNHGACSPPSEPVRKAVAQVMDDFSRRGIQAGPDWAERRAGLRLRIAKLIGAPAGSIALMPNTSNGVALVASSLKWKTGDRILLIERDFPTNVCPWLEAAKRLELEPVFLPWADFTQPAGCDLSRLEGELRRGARVVVVSLTHFSSGLRLPVESIARMCKAAGAELFVDAIQGLGAMPFAVDGIDYVACGGHKADGPYRHGFSLRKARAAGLARARARGLAQL